MKRLQVRVWCRQRGALGIFEARWFEITPTEAGPVDDWIREHGEAFELHHIEPASLKPTEPTR